MGRIPMETNTRFTSKDVRDQTGHCSEKIIFGKYFPYIVCIGSLMYLASCTRPYIAYAVEQLSRYVKAFTQQHIGVVK